MSRPRAIVPIGSEEAWHRMMVYGQPGVGKTVLAGSGPKTLILASDAGETISAAGMGSTADVWVTKTYEDIDEAFEYLRHEGHQTYDWVWVDNITLLQDQAMDLLLEELVKEKPHRSRWVPDQHEYLVNQNRLSTMVRSFKKLPMNVGFTAHMMKSEDDDGKVLYLPMVQGGQGALSQKLCGYMNIVGYLTTVKKDDVTHRQMILEPRAKYLAKGRFPGMAGSILDPTIPKLERAIAASRTKVTAPVTEKTTTKVSAA